MARRAASSARCAYRCVVLGSAWPSRAPIIGNPKLPPTPTEANVCRRSWMRTPLTPARFNMAAQGRVKSARGFSFLVPADSPAMTNAPSLVSPLRISTAALGKNTTFLPVFESGNVVFIDVIGTSSNARNGYKMHSLSLGD